MSLNTEWRCFRMKNYRPYDPYQKVLISYETLLQLHLLKSWNETFYLFIFTMRLLRPFHQERDSQNTKDVAAETAVWDPIKSFLVLWFYCASLHYCCSFLFVYMQSEHSPSTRLLMIWRSLNIALCKYLAFSVYVWFIETDIC